MLRKIIITAISMSFILINPLFAETHNSSVNATQSSKQEPMTGWKKRHEMRQKLIQELNLTEDQQQQIRQIRQQHYQRVIPDFKKKHAIQQQIMMMSMQKEIDKDSLDALLKQRSELSTDILRSKILMRHQIYQVLNDDQRTKLKGIMKEKMEKMKHMMQKKMQPAQ